MYAKPNNKIKKLIKEDPFASDYVVLLFVWRFKAKN